MKLIPALLLTGVLGLPVLAAALADDPPAKTGAKPEIAPAEARRLSQEALEPLGGLVGEWRGVGRPRRNSSADAWIEKGEWVWEIKKEHVGLRQVVKEGRLLSTALLTYDPAGKKFVLEATLPDKSQRRYTGTLAGNRLALETERGEDGRTHEIEIKILTEKRTVVLFQAKQGNQQQFSLVGEVGYTREGTKLAEEGVVGPECIVTGGKGTMSTVYKGKTYWFCCTGCRDAFNEDPDGIIAEAQERAARKQAEKEKKRGK